MQQTGRLLAARSGNGETTKQSRLLHVRVEALLFVGRDRKGMPGRLRSRNRLLPGRPLATEPPESRDISPCASWPACGSPPRSQAGGRGCAALPDPPCYSLQSSDIWPSSHKSASTPSFRHVRPPSKSSRRSFSACSIVRSMRIMLRSTSGGIPSPPHRSTSARSGGRGRGNRHAAILRLWRPRERAPSRHRSSTRCAVSSVVPRILSPPACSPSVSPSHLNHISRQQRCIIGRNSMHRPSLLERAGMITV